MVQALIREQKNDLSVLIIDDEESIVESLSGVLRDEGFSCRTANSGDEGIRQLTEHRAQIVFLDMWMPGKDGLETLREIKKISPNTEVVMISGHATIPNALEAIKAGALDFLEKPFTIQSVTNSLERAMQAIAESESGKPTNGDTILMEMDGSDTDDALSILGDLQRTSASSMVSGLVNPGSYTKQFPGRNLGQRTINKSIVLYGQCLHSGMKSGLVLEPLPPNSGIHFSHLGSEASVPAYVSYVQSTTLATTVRSEKVSASTVEHLLSALAAYDISNLLIKCNGEIPIFDGSALTFCEAIEKVGLQEQEGDWFELLAAKEVHYAPPKAQEGEGISVIPSDVFKITYRLDYPKPVGVQEFTFVLDGPESFKKEIAPARTFGFMKDIEQMQRMGLAAGGRLDNFILINDDGVVNTDLRFPDELVRHKILDIIGDLFLSGRKLRAHVVASMTGHADNIAVLRDVVSASLAGR